MSETELGGLGSVLLWRGRGSTAFSACRLPALPTCSSLGPIRCACLGLACCGLFLLGSERPRSPLGLALWEVNPAGSMFSLQLFVHCVSPAEGTEAEALPGTGLL